MKLSEALREADRRGIPNIRGNFWSSRKNMWNGEMWPACAIGAANVVAGNARLVRYNDKFHIEGTINQLWGFEYSQAIHYVCPAYDEEAIYQKQKCRCHLRYPGGMKHSIIHLYDFHRWTRTQIADWIDSLEVYDVQTVSAQA